MMSNKDFFQKVYEVVKMIPSGRVTSYGAIARYLGSPKSSRMVGWALSQSSCQEEFVPAHRVVNRNGFLTGKKNFGAPKIMEELLTSEGLTIEGDMIKNFHKVFWDPLEQLNNF